MFKTSVMTYKLIIFDLDGVIVKSNSILRNVIDECDKNDCLEISAMSLISCIGSIFGRPSKKRILSTIEMFSSKFTGIYPPKVEVVNFIKCIRGYKMAILSSDTKWFIKKNLKRLGISDKFDVIVSGDDDVKMKPDPDGLMKILEDTKIDPCEAIYYGGGPIDEITGKKVKVKTVSSLNELKREVS